MEERHGKVRRDWMSEGSESEIASRERFDVVYENESGSESDSGMDSSSLTSCWHDAVAVIGVDNVAKTLWGRTKAGTIKEATSISDLIIPDTSEDGVLTLFDIESEVFNEELRKEIQEDRNIVSKIILYSLGYGSSSVNVVKKCWAFSSKSEACEVQVVGDCRPPLACSLLSAVFGNEIQEARSASSQKDPGRS